MSCGCDGSSGNAENGRRLFMEMCANCHTTERNGKHLFGPNLFGLFGRKVGSAQGYHYSDDLRNKGVVWNRLTLTQYLKNTKDFAPGSKAPGVHTKKQPDRGDIVAFLEQATK